MRAGSAKADVVIVGGGIMGAATAFFLARRGRSVILLERDIVGRHASGTNFGNVRRQGRFLPQLPLANRSRELWGKLPDLIGEDVEFLPSGHIRIATDAAHVERLETYATAARDYGLHLELLSGNSLRDRFPFMAPGLLLGSYSPYDGHANPRLAAPAFARAAQRLGVRIIEGAEVLSIEKDAEDFRIDAGASGLFQAPVVQISAGAWGGRIAAQFGEAAPLTVQGPQMAVTEPVPYRIAPVIGIEQAIYFRQVKRGNIVLGGGKRGPACLDTKLATVDPLNTLRQLPVMARLVPGLAKLNIIRSWSGVEGYMEDDIPVMGRSSKVPGLFYAFGFCGHGFQLGPGVGDTMAELIVTGRSTVPIAPFSIGRFAHKSVL